MRGVAEAMLDHHAAAEIVADRVFLGHADAAMQLDCVLRDKARGLADPDLDHRDVVGAFGGVRLVHHHRGEHRHAARLLQ